MKKWIFKMYRLGLHQHQHHIHSHHHQTHHHPNCHQIWLRSRTTSQPSWSSPALACRHLCLHNPLSPWPPCHCCLSSWVLAGPANVLVLEKGNFPLLFCSCWTYWKLPTLWFRSCCREFSAVSASLLWGWPAVFMAGWCVIFYEEWGLRSC